MPRHEWRDDDLRSRDRSEMGYRRDRDYRDEDRDRGAFFGGDRNELSARPLPKLLVRGAQHAERRGDREWAISLYERAVACDKTNGAASLQALMKVGTMLKIKGDMNGARAAFTRARQHPACTAEWGPTIDAKLAQVGGPETPWA